MIGIGWAFIIAAALCIPGVLIYDAVRAKIRARIQSKED
jgi:hypothetical protein